MCLEDLSKNNYDGLFQQPFFRKLKFLHDVYGVKFNLYIYYKSQKFDLTQVPDRYKNEFEENADWLKFGYHAYQPEFDTLSATVEMLKYMPLANNEIQRFASRENITDTYRFHYYFATDSMLTCCYRQGARTLLGADTENRISYGLIHDEPTSLWWYNADNQHSLCGGVVERTDWRLERDGLSVMVVNGMQDKTFIVFTHEWCFNKLAFMKMIILMTFLRINNYIFYNNL